MASLKEVKGRIATVNNTRKITSAMKMVASAKLHKAQATIANMLPYEERLHRLLMNFLTGGQIDSPTCRSVKQNVWHWLSFLPTPAFAEDSMPTSSSMPSNFWIPIKE